MTHPEPLGGPYDEHHFAGIWTDADGKQHMIKRVTCTLCGVTLSEIHYGCCGHMACGFDLTAPHQCVKGAERSAR